MKAVGINNARNNNTGEVGSWCWEERQERVLNDWKGLGDSFSM